MFTGIIEGFGSIVRAAAVPRGRRLAIRAGFDLAGTAVGDSIAVNGACLTVVTLAGRQFEADVSAETLACTTLGEASTGERVNLERALRLGDRLDGHLVLGHVDGTGRIQSREAAGSAMLIAIRVPGELTRYLIAKGSVAVDGASLTVNAVMPDGFRVAVIPHTAAMTTIGDKAVGARVNIETDLIGKYVERFVTRPATGGSAPGRPAAAIDKELLARSGFLT